MNDGNAAVHAASDPSAQSRAHVGRPPQGPPPLWRSLRRVLTANELRLRFRERFLIDYLFIHINKAGGKSIEAALRLPFRHQTAREIRDRVGRRAFDRRFVFSFVRNPWDKVVSQFHYLKVKGRVITGSPPFNEWVKLAFEDRDPFWHDKPRHFMPQRDWLTDESGEIMVDFVGQFENFKEDFAHVCREIGVQAELPHLNRTERRPYQEYYDAASRGIIERAFAKDIEQWGYRFE
jgi:hypothetical protein